MKYTLTMKYTYCTKVFEYFTEQSIADWLNSFEEKRNGRANVHYWVEIYDKTVVGEKIILTIRIQELSE